MTTPPSNKILSKALKLEALLMGVNCVRNTVIENYHAGHFPKSKTGDYSDVKVVTPYGEIAWNDLSRISDSEMMAFNKEVADRLYTYLQFLLNPHITAQEKEDFMKYINSYFPYNWDEPKLDRGFIGSNNRRNKMFDDM